MANQIVQDTAAGAGAGAALGPYGALAGAALGAGLGAAQWYKGHKLEKQNVRPTYQIPEEYKHYLSTAEQMALQGLPEEQRQQYLDNVSRNIQAGITGLNSRRAGIQGIAGVVGQANEADKNLLVADANAKMQNIQRLQQARQGFAGYQDKAFQLNKYEPFVQNLNYARSLEGAGMQNVMGAANTLQNAGQAYDQNQLNKQALGLGYNPLVPH